jgi:hypothetical protein
MEGAVGLGFFFAAGASDTSSSIADSDSSLALSLSFSLSLSIGSTSTSAAVLCEGRRDTARVRRRHNTRTLRAERGVGGTQAELGVL